MTFLWSTSWILIKVGLVELPPLTFAALRYTLASVALAGLLLRRPPLRAELRSLSAPDWLKLAVLGVVFYTLTQGAMFLGLKYLPAITLSLALSFTPVAVALLGILFLGERLSRWQWLGVAAFLTGAVIYLAPGGKPLGVAGAAIALFALGANAAGAILGRGINRGRRHHALTVTVVSMGIGSVGLLAVALSVEEWPRLGVGHWLTITWLALINTAFAFTLWNHTLRRLTAIQSSVINNTMLIQIALLAWFFLGETVRPIQTLGLLLAASGALAVQFKTPMVAAQNPRR